MRLTVPLAFALSLAAAAAAAQDIERGAQLYAGHCAVCHGGSATGDGLMAEVLTVRPADLTALAAAEGGVFPMERVVRAIDGRTVLISHGGPMPIFGRMLGGDGAVIDAPDGTPVITKTAVVDIAAWLATIQR